MKIGDKVRFLSEVGEGRVVGFQGKDIALVEDADGFEIPMQIKELVVVQTDEYNIPTSQQKQKRAEETPHAKSDVAAPYRGKTAQGSEVVHMPLLIIVLLLMWSGCLSVSIILSAVCLLPVR